MALESFFSSINNMFNIMREPLSPVPSVILAQASTHRPGLSAKLIAGNIIRRQSEAGAPSGENIDGSKNIAEAMEVIRVEEILKALMIDGKIEIAIPVGGITTVGQGGNAGGPVVVTSQNVYPVQGTGIIR